MTESALAGKTVPVKQERSRSKFDIYKTKIIEMSSLTYSFKLTRIAQWLAHSTLISEAHILIRHTKNKDIATKYTTHRKRLILLIEGKAVYG